MVSIILFIYLLVSNKIKPYSQLNLNYVDSLSVSLILLSINLALLNVTSQNDLVVLISLISIYGVNIYFIMKMLKYLFIK